VIEITKRYVPGGFPLDAGRLIARFRAQPRTNASGATHSLMVKSAFLPLASSASRDDLSYATAMRVSIVMVLALLAAAAQANPDQLLRNAIDAQMHGDYSAAIRDYRKVLELQPNMLEVKVNLAAALVHVGQFDEAIAIYRAALPSVPDKAPVQLNLALAYFKKGDFQNAHEQLEPLYRAQPNRVQTAILLAATEIELNKPESAVAVLGPLEQANSGNLDLKYALGAALIKCGKQREGVTRIAEVAESRHSADAYMLAGKTLLDLGEFERARQNLDAALSLDPKLPGIQTLAGRARDGTGNKEQAEAAFRQALRIDADDFEANLYLGSILAERRELDEAKTYLDRALKLNPSNSMARYESAMLESKTGHYEVAVGALESLTKDDPNWLDPHVQLAALYYRLHRSEDGARERQIVDRITAEQQAKGPGKQ